MLTGERISTVTWSLHLTNVSTGKCYACWHDVQQAGGGTHMFGRFAGWQLITLPARIISRALWQVVYLTPNRTVQDQSQRKSVFSIMSFQQKKRDCHVLTTLASHTWLSFQLKREPPPCCVPCNESLSLEHGLLDYLDLTDVRNSLILIFGGCCSEVFLRTPSSTPLSPPHTFHTATHTNASHTHVLF